MTGHSLSANGLPVRRRISADGPPRPARSPVRGLDVAFLISLNVGVVTALWEAHGGTGRLGGAAGWWVSIGQLSALYGTLTVLAVLILIARVPWLERRYGMDRLNLWHRWTGFAAVTLLTLHALATTVGYAVANHVGLWSQITEFMTSFPNVLAATVGMALLVGVAVTSVRAARRALSYETWWLLHLYAYLAVALSFSHQFAVGTDFMSDWWARLYWALLYAATTAVVFGHRWFTPAVRAVRHRLVVMNVEPEAPGVVTLVIGGRHLDRLPVEAGQFFLLRFLRRDRWWKAMPLSLSAPPDGRTLRFTVKAVGDDTRAIQQIPLGTPVMAEGPYGVFTSAGATRRKVLLIAGGIGIAPVRAIYEDLDRRPGEVTLLYRTARKEDGVFLDDLHRISEERGFGMFVSFSRHRDRSNGSNPFTPENLWRVVPDLAERDVFVCGPPAMVAAAHRALRRSGVAPHQIHMERFAY